MMEEFDARDFDSEDAVHTGGIPEPGQYHCLITGVEVDPADNSGNAINGIRMTFEVLAGTTANQVGKRVRETFYRPNAGQKDGGAFCRKRLAAVGFATGLIQPGQVAAIDWADTQGRQCIVHLKEEKYTGRDGDERTSIKVDGCHIFSVNHPTQVHVPKNQEALELLDDAPAATAASQPAARQQQPVGATAGNAPADKWGDL